MDGGAVATGLVEVSGVLAMPLSLVAEPLGVVFLFQLIPNTTPITINRTITAPMTQAMGERLARIGSEPCGS